METSDVALVVLIVLVPAALMWAIFLARSGRPGKTKKPRLGIPPALRPAEPDDILEGRRLERIQVGGLLSVLVAAAFIPIYWLPESERQQRYVDRFHEQSLHRGEAIYNPPPVLEEDTDAVAFRELEEGIQLGQNCAFCHGGEAQGGPVPNGFVDPERPQMDPVQYEAPPLNNVFTRWDDEIVRFTIERGRPGTPMPAWGVEYGGPMNEQAVSDVMEYLKSFPQNQEPPELPDNASGQEIFEARCAVCHGPEGQGKDNDSLWYSGMALWEGKVGHLSREQHLWTIRGGRRFAFMPQFSETPPQGIPVPPYPLTDEQIEAVMEYERNEL